MRTPPRRRFSAGLAALLAVALVVVAVGVVVAVRVLGGGGDCGDVLGARRTGEDAALRWAAQPGEEAAGSGAVDALEGTDAVGDFRGAIALTNEVGGTTVFSTASDSIVTVSLSNTSDNQVARAFNGVAPDAEVEPWTRSFTSALATTNVGAGVLYAIGLDDDGLEVVSVDGASGEERWCRSVGGSEGGDPATVSADRVEDGDLIVGRGGGDEGGAVVARLAQDDGTPAWTAEAEDLPAPVRLIAGEEVTAFGGRRAPDERPRYESGGATPAAPVVAVGSADGTEAWRYAPAEEAGVQWHPYLVGEAAGVHVVLDHGASRSTATVTPPRLVGIDGGGEVLWTQPLRNNLDINADDILVAGDVVVVAGSRRADGARSLTARRVADGSTAWDVDLRTGVLRANRVAVANGWLLTAGLAGVEAVELETGAVEVVLDGVPVPDIAAEPGGLVAAEVNRSILVFDAPA